MFSKFISIGDKIELQAVSHEYEEKQETTSITASMMLPSSDLAYRSISESGLQQSMKL